MKVAKKKSLPDWHVWGMTIPLVRSEEHTSELQSRPHLVCRLLLEKKNAMVIAADDIASDEMVVVYERIACPTCGFCSGIFTANSMNCLTEALGLSLPGNSTTLANNSELDKILLKAARNIVEITKHYYEQEDESVLPRNIATFEALENAIFFF